MRARPRIRDLEADAVEIRMRATRRLDELRVAQKEAGGLANGGRPRKTGLSDNPVYDSRPSFASHGIDKNLAHQARVLGRLSDEQFEQAVCRRTRRPTDRALFEFSRLWIICPALASRPEC